MNKAKSIIFSSFLALAVSMLPLQSVKASQVDIEKELSQHYSVKKIEKPTLTGSPYNFCKKTLFDATDNMSSQVKVACRIANGLRNGNPDAFISEVLDVFVAHLAGRKHTHLFSKHNEEFNEKELSIAVKNLSERFYGSLQKMITKRKDIYGITEDGQTVTIYDRSTILKKVADSLIPNNLPGRGILVGLFGHPLIESAISKMMAKKFTKALREILSDRKTTLKGELGKLPKNIYVYMQQPSDFNLEDYLPKKTPDVVKDALTLLKPRLTHAYRDVMTQALKQARSIVLNQMDRKLRETAVKAFQGATSVVGAGMGYATGEMTQYLLDSVPLVNYVNRYIPVSQSLFALGGYSGWAFGGYVGHAAYKNAVSGFETQTNHMIGSLSYKLAKLTVEEHALYGLNPKASQIELDLFREGYELRDRISISAFNTLKAFAHYAGAEELVRELYKVGTGAYKMAKATLDWFTTHKNGTVREFLMDQKKLKEFVHPKQVYFDSTERGLRRLLVLKKNNPKAYKEVLENIKKYPSFSMKAKQIGQIAEKDQKKDERANEKQRTSRVQLVESLRKNAANIAGETNLDEKTVLNAILDLSVTEQDIIAQFSSNQINSIKSKLDNKTSLEKALKAEVEELGKGSFSEYLEKNSQAIANLKKHSITNGFTTGDLVELHKRVVSKSNQYAFLLDEPENVTKDVAIRERDIIKARLTEIVSKQKGIFLGEILEEQLKTSGALEKIARKVLEIETKESAQLKQKAYSILNNDEVFNKVNTAIKPLRDHGAKNTLIVVDKVKDAYNNIRTVLLNKLVTNPKAFITETEKAEGQKKASTEKQNVNQSKSFIPAFSLWSKKSNDEGAQTLPKKLETNETLENQIKAALNKKRAETPLQIYADKRPGYFFLAQHVNELKKENGWNKHPSQFEDKDLKNIQKFIFQKKWETLPKTDKYFWKSYEAELQNHLLTDGYYKDRLFYGLEDVKTDLEFENQEILKDLFKA